MKKIKVLFLAKQTPSSVQALEYILSTTAIVERAVIRERDYRLKEICERHQIQVCNEEQLLEDSEKGCIAPDYLISFYWKRITQNVLNIAKIGSINFHPGPLPEARGSGYHAAILNQWGYWGVTAHYMDATFDTGEIIECRHFPIEDDIVNKDLVLQTHQALFSLFCDIFDRMLRMEHFQTQKQGEGVYYSLKELEKSKFIIPEDTSEIIDRKIRAFWNPPYSGAQVNIAGKNYTIINKNILDWIVKKMGGGARINRKILNTPEELAMNLHNYLKQWLFLTVQKQNLFHLSGFLLVGMFGKEGTEYG